MSKLYRPIKINFKSLERGRYVSQKVIWLLGSDSEKWKRVRRNMRTLSSVKSLLTIDRMIHRIT